MQARPLPDQLLREPFSVATALAAGIGRERLRRPDLLVPTRGARTDTTPADLAGRLLAVQAGLAERTAFSHVSAAQLHGLPLPSRLQEQQVRDVMTTTGGGQVERRDCQGHRGLERRNLVQLHGVRVTSMAETWCDLADSRRRGLTVEDLVVVGDAVVAQLDGAVNAHVREGATTSPGVRALHEALGRRVRPRGKVALREALSLIRPRVRSPMESRARLLFLAADLPEPVVNYNVRDEAGEWLAEVDLAWPDRRAGVEYQGADHADRRRRSADAARVAVLGDHGWTIHEAFAEDIFNGGRRTAFLRRVERTLGWHPPVE